MNEDDKLRAEIEELLGYSKIVWSENDAINQMLSIINPNYPRKGRALSNMPLKKGTVCILKISGYSFAEITLMTGHTTETIKRYIETGIKMYPELKEYRL